MFRAYLMLQHWPDKIINRDDSEYDIFAKHFKQQNEEVAVQIMKVFEDSKIKSTNCANTFRAMGNESFKNEDLTEALRLYNCSVFQAPRHSVQFALAVANRSAVLFDMKQYQECLQDINIVLRSEYPEDMLYKIYLRRTKCFMEMNLYDNARNSLGKTQQFFNTAKQTLGRLQIVKIADKIKDVKEELEKKPLNDASSKNIQEEFSTFELKLTSGENPKYLYASSALEIRSKEKYGRYVIASKDIQKGDVLYVEEPYACTQQTPNINYCNQCFNYSVVCVPCSSCTVAFYCSDLCREKSWNDHHQWICKGGRCNILTVDMHLCFIILFQATRDQFKTAIPNESVYGDKENNYPFFDRLMTNKKAVPMDLFRSRVQMAVWMVVYLKHFTNFLDWFYAQPNRPDGNREQLPNIIGGLLLKYMLQITCNAERVLEGQIILKDLNLMLDFNTVARAIYVSSALLNHSCIPNAAQKYHNSTKIVRALKDIKKGDEVTVSYLIGITLVLEEETLVRTLQLKQYGFMCKCRACEEPSFLRPFLCPRCTGRAFGRPDDRRKKCVDCFHVFSVFVYEKFHAKISEEVNLFKLTCDIRHLTNLEKFMKKTLHKHNLLFLAVYGNYIKYYKGHRKYKECLDYMKRLLDLKKILFGDTSKQYLSSLIKFSLEISQYYAILRRSDATDIQYFLEQAEEILKASEKALEYYASPRMIINYRSKLTEFLHSDGFILPFINEEQFDFYTDIFSDL